MIENLKRLLYLEDVKPGASEETIQTLSEALKTKLPEDYKEFLRFSNGYAGSIGEEGHLILWPAEEVPQANVDYKATEWAPGLVLIASNGCGAGIGIDTRCGDSSTMDYVTFDWIDLEWGHEERRFP